MADIMTARDLRDRFAADDTRVRNPVAVSGECDCPPDDDGFLPGTHDVETEPPTHWYPGASVAVCDECGKERY